MLPIQHFIVAAAPVFFYILIRDRQLPSYRLLGVVFFGSQFPDLIDKPLAYQAHVIPTGRVFMHSLPTAIPLLLFVALYGWQTGRSRLSSAFIIAHLLHLLADHYRALLGLEPTSAHALLWPIGPTIPAVTTPHWAGPGEIYLHVWTIISVAIVAAATLVLIRSEEERLGVCLRYVARTTFHLRQMVDAPR